MPSDWRFADVQKLLESNGWTLKRTRGSHHYFIGQHREPISVPVHKGKVKFVYVRQVQRAIDELEKDREDRAR